MKNNITMLILSCDKFSDLWDGHIKLLDQNWPDRNMETWIVTDDNTEKEYRGIHMLAAGTEGEWSDRLAFALKQVKTDYVFITLDDYFLIHKVDQSAIIDLVNMMEKEQIDYVRLFPKPQRATLQEIPGYRNVHYIDISQNYSVNLYSGIWKKAFVESCVKKPLNVWMFEVQLHKRAEEYRAKCAVSLRKEFRILDVVRKGKLLHRAVAYFRRHPGIYTGNREVNTWKYEIMLTIQQQASSHLPRWLHKKVKSFMTKRGHRYFSDQAE